MGKAANKIENYLKERVELLGGETRKYTSPSRRGVFDRIVLLPKFMCFVEIKAPGDRLSALQRLEQKTLSQLSIPNAILESRNDVDKFLMGYMAAMQRNMDRRAKDATQSNELP